MRNYTNNLENRFPSNFVNHAPYRGLYCVWTREGGELLRRWIDPEAESNRSADEKETIRVETEVGKQRCGTNLWAA
jgi:hypothetical protein